MAQSVYCYVKDEGGSDITGGCNVANQKGAIEVLGFHFHGGCELPEDIYPDPYDTVFGRRKAPRNTNQADLVNRMTRRSYKPIEIIAELDRAYIPLLKAMNEAQRMQEVKFVFTRNPPSGSGDSEHFMTILTHESLVTTVEPYQGDATQEEGRGQLMRICFGLLNFECTHEVLGVTMEDHYRDSHSDD